MKKVSIFLILYLFLVYFMLVTVFCYQLGKTGTLTEAFEGLWKATPVSYTHLDVYKRQQVFSCV